MIANFIVVVTVSILTRESRCDFDDLDADMVPKSPGETNSARAHDTQPLRWAIITKDAEQCGSLLQDPPEMSELSTYLNIAARFSSPDIVRQILRLGCDPDVRDGNGFTPLHSVCYDSDRTDEDGEDIAVSLLVAGANAEVENARGYRPLHFASTRSLRGVVRVLLAAGADPNGGGDGGVGLFHPLLAAITYDNYDSAVALLACGARSHESLDRAVVYGRAKAVKALLALGIDANARTFAKFWDAWQTPLDALTSRFPSTVTDWRLQRDILMALMKEGAEVRMGNAKAALALILGDVRSIAEARFQNLSPYEHFMKNDLKSVPNEKCYGTLVRRVLKSYLGGDDDDGGGTCRNVFQRLIRYEDEGVDSLYAILREYKPEGREFFERNAVAGYYSWILLERVYEKLLGPEIRAGTYFDYIPLDITYTILDEFAANEPAFEEKLRRRAFLYALTFGRECRQDFNIVLNGG